MSYKVNKNKHSSYHLSALNIPSKFQNVNINNIYFAPILTDWDKTKIVTPEKQLKWLKKVLNSLKEKKELSTKILIHSRPTDDSALKIAFKIMLTAIDNGYSAKAYNLGYFSKNYESDANIEYDLILFYSLNSYSSDYKIDLIRDLLKKCDKSIVIVVTTCPKFGEGAMSALDFNYEYINYRFNGYLQIDEIQ